MSHHGVCRARTVLIVTTQSCRSGVSPLFLSMGTRDSGSRIRGPDANWRHIHVPTSLKPMVRLVLLRPLPP